MNHLVLKSGAECQKKRLSKIRWFGVWIRNLCRLPGNSNTLENYFVNPGNSNVRVSRGMTVYGILSRFSLKGYGGSKLGVSLVAVSRFFTIANHIGITLSIGSTFQSFKNMKEIFSQIWCRPSRTNSFHSSSELELRI